MDRTTDLPSPNYRWNFLAFLVDLIFWSLALSFANPDSVLPAFVRHFTESAPIIGLVSTVWNGCSLIPQVAAARVMNDKPRKKPYLLAGLSGRVAFWVIALALSLGLAHRPAKMLLLFFLCVGLFNIPDGLAAVAWGDMLARAIPLKRRGRLLGIGQILSGLAGLGAGAVIDLILESPNIPFPANYALIFTLAGVAFIPSTVALALLRESGIDTTNTEAHDSPPHFLLTPLREDAAFRRLMTCHILVGMVLMATPFYVVYATDVLNLPVAVVGSFVAAQQVAAVAFGALFGLISDRWGSTATIRIGSAISVAGPLFALLAHVARSGLLIRAYPVVYAGLAAYQSSRVLGFYNYLLEIAPNRTRPSYVGLTNTIMGVLTFAPTLGGWLLEATSYTVLFGITAALVSVGALISLGLKPAIPMTSAEPHP